jgi:hypothetical protein
MNKISWNKDNKVDSEEIINRLDDRDIFKRDKIRRDSLKEEVCKMTDQTVADIFMDKLCDNYITNKHGDGVMIVMD